jgi:tetratricopeptide (TPR) repeat protein
VLGAMHAIYSESGKLDEFLKILEDERTRNPENRVAVEQLVEIYAQQKRMPEAARVLDATREAVAGDPDLLYYVSHLYQRIDQKPTSDQVLRDVLTLDPDHAPAANDLGYSWAEQGANLADAEALTRLAVRADPENGSFLDSLGWVLYKRGRFAEARRTLDQAVSMAGEAGPDPVVLDHLGDVLYRQGDAAGAADQWTRAAERLERTSLDRDDLRHLRLHLDRKNKQVKSGHPVNVAPVIEEPTQTANERQASDDADDN